MAKKKSFIDEIDNPAELFITKPQPTGKAEQTERAETPKRDPKEAQPETIAPPPKGYRLNPDLPLYVETRSRRMQILLTPTQAEQIKARAQEQGISANQFINNAINNALKED